MDKTVLPVANADPVPLKATDHQHLTACVWLSDCDCKCRAYNIEQLYNIIVTARTGDHVLFKTLCVATTQPIHLPYYIAMRLK